MTTIAIVRPPHTYFYNDLDVREDALITYLYGYFSHLGIPTPQIFDFHLQRDLHFETLVKRPYDFYIVTVRETGDNVHYALRIAAALSKSTQSAIWLYGQTARLKLLEPLPDRVQICPHNEALLAEQLGISGSAPSFTEGLIAQSYFSTLNLNRSQIHRRKASLETTRGCHYPCDFCFINHGQNYPKRWQIRPNDSIIADIKNYQSIGISNIVFNDSEFFGANQNDHANKRILISRIIKELEPIRYKIYSRADTLLKFNDVALLKESGLVSVFVGAESLHQPDLDALNKRLSVPTILKCIDTLREEEIFMDISFISFNRNTSTESLRANLLTLKQLFSENSRYLGMPNFTFSFESNWGKGYVSDIPSATYVGLDVMMKSPPANGPGFDAKLEPLMEIYRLLSYEWSSKVTSLNYSRENATVTDLRAIECWFERLGGFCIDTMLHFLNEFQTKKLSFKALGHAREELFLRISEFYLCLPEYLRSLSTYDNHASALAYGSDVIRLEEKEYWDHIIPADGKLQSFAAKIENNDKAEFAN